MVAHHHPHPTQTVTLDLDLDEFSLIVSETRNNPRARQMLRNHLVVSILERTKLAPNDPRAKQHCEKVERFTDRCIAIVDKHTERKRCVIELSKAFKNGGELNKALEDIIGESVDSRSKSFLDVVRARMKSILSAWQDATRDILQAINDDRNDPAHRVPTSSSSRKSSSTVEALGVALPGLVGGVKSAVSSILLDEVKACLLNKDRQATEHEKLREKRVGQLKRLFPDPYVIPSEVSVEFTHIGELSEAHYATVYDRAIMAAMKVREEQRSRVTQAHENAALGALREHLIN